MNDNLREGLVALMMYGSAFALAAYVIEQLLRPRGAAREQAAKTKHVVHDALPPSAREN